MEQNPEILNFSSLYYEERKTDQITKKQFVKITKFYTSMYDKSVFRKREI